jgi:hypothetical protein
MRKRPSGPMHGLLSVFCFLGPGAASPSSSRQWSWLSPT